MKRIAWITGVIMAAGMVALTAFTLPQGDKKKDQGEKIDWLTLEEAYALNQKAPRKIFVDVYTDWCGWCKKMDRDTFSDPEVATYVNDHYYAVKLDAESNRSFKLGEHQMTEQLVAQQFGVRSFPTIVFIHEDFKNIQAVPGYRKAEEFKEILTKFAAIELKN